MSDDNVRAIVNYFEENPDVFEECIEELDSYEGYLDERRYYDMEDLPLFLPSDPFEALNLAFFGYDEKTNSDHFNPNRDYFRFNGYGNLVSADSKDYSMFVDSYAVCEMAENINWISSISRHPELDGLFEELLNDDDEDEE